MNDIGIILSTIWEFEYTKEVTIKIETSEIFDRWLRKQTAKDRAQVDRRLLAIKDHDHFGDTKHLGNGLFELRWKSGRRIYFARSGENSLLLLLGGLKNEQVKQIKKARKMLQ